MHGTWVLAVVLLMLVGSLGLATLAAPGSGASPGAPASARSSGTGLAADPATHGDLVVGPGQTYIIQPILGSHSYYQGGNITVEAGGTLDVWNVTLSFVSFVSNTGNAMQRLSHIFYFHDAGTVNFYAANLTTDVEVLNAYAKLNFTVTGTLNAWSSHFEFPGWLYIHGSQAVATLNQSSITWNPAVADLIEPTTIYGDTLWAPTVNVSAGATLNLLASQIDHPYADDTTTYGFARPTPLNFIDRKGYVIPKGGSQAFGVNGPNDSANLTIDWLYPTADALSGTVTIIWTGSTVSNTTVSVSVVYGTAGTFLLRTGLNFTVGSSGAASIPFTSALLDAITSGGMLQYLNYTGDFAVANSIDVQIQNTAGSYSNITSINFQLNTTGPTYDDFVTGAGSTLSAVNAGLQFNWNQYNSSVGAAYSSSAPFPWDSNKLHFNDGAVGYLANVTTPDEDIPGVFSASAVLPDASSQVFTYRWAQFNLTGRGGVLPIQGATLSVYYAYGSSQSNNATTAALNDIQTADPAIWGYVQYWDQLNGVVKYGTSNAAGEASLLLAASNITGSSLPDGRFLGNYHIGVSVPAVGVAPHWFNWSYISPYPQGVAAGSAHYNGPDFAPPQNFADYFGAVTVSSVSITANSLAPSAQGVDIGQTLGVRVKVADAGTATIDQVLLELYYNSSLSPKVLLAVNETTTLDLTAVGQTATFTLSWVVNDTITGLHGWFDHNLTLLLEWNYNIESLAGGNVTQSVPVAFAPSMIKITSFSLPPTTLQLNQIYLSTGTVVYNGSAQATIQLYAIPLGSTTLIEVAEGTALSGNFTLTWFPLGNVLSPGTTYTLSATATYNHRTTYDNLTGTYSVPKPPTSPASFLFQTFFGLPIWLWLAIAAAAVVGIVLFLLFARRQAAGKLVECGECGNLIPEDATVCPKCGAEFESDLIRCSRCASTIPADSKFCPECAAQLLGKPGEAESDPEKQAYADFTGKFRAEAKRELGDNYTEGAFWDWWKRQPTYTPFSQWSLQQGQGTARAGMTAPPAGATTTPETPPGKAPPRGGAGAWAEPARPAAAAPAPRGPQPPPAAAPPAQPTVPPAAPGANLKPCPSCGKEIPAEYLVCPFCNAVTQ